MSRVNLLGEIGVAHVFHIDRWCGQTCYHRGKFMLLRFGQAYGFHPLHSITMEMEFVAYGQSTQQLHECLATDFRHTIEEQNLTAGNSGVIQLGGVQ